MQIRVHVSRWLLSAALLSVSAITSAAEEDPGEPTGRDRLVVSTLLKLEKIDLSEKPAAKLSVLRVLHAERGTERYLELAEKFALQETAPELVRLALANPDKSLGVNAVRVLFKMGDRSLVEKVIAGNDAEAATMLAILQLLGDPKANDLALPLVTTTDRSVAVRSNAVVVLGKNKPGAVALLKIIEEKKLPDDLQFAAANVLLTSIDAAVRDAASMHLKLPETADAKPLPPIADLAKRSGNADRGKQLFTTTATCIKCHKVRGEGKDVGPDLSEIGTKLSKEALYLSILDPSAGISFNYETHTVLRDDGSVLTGILVSSTDEELQLKTADAIVIKIPKAEIEEMKKQNVSLMPAGIQKLLKADDLVDIVEFLTTLKKAGG